MPTTPSATPRLTPVLKAALSGVLDLAWVVLFVVIGRVNHDKGVNPAGVVSTLWPFALGLAVGWLVARGWRRPTALWPTGIVVWLGCVTIGMVFRVVSGQGTVAAFIGVALAFVGLGLLGWRAIFPIIRRRRQWHA